MLSLCLFGEVFPACYQSGTQPFLAEIQAAFRHNPPMDTSLRILRIIWGALLTSIVFYTVVGELVGRTRQGVDTTMYKAIAVVAIITVAMILGVRRLMMQPALNLLAGNAPDAAALLRWRGASIVTMALCEAVALYGFVLRMQGFTLSQVAPFYVGGLLLLVYFGPRRPASNPLSASASTLG